MKFGNKKVIVNFKKNKRKEYQKRQMSQMSVGLKKTYKMKIVREGELKKVNWN